MKEKPREEREVGFPQGVPPKRKLMGKKKGLVPNKQRNGSFDYSLPVKTSREEGAGV